MYGTHKARYGYATMKHIQRFNDTNKATLLMTR